MRNQAFTGCRWTVFEDGRMTFGNEYQVIYEIEPDTLADPDRYDFIRCHPDLNEKDYYLNYLKACKMANISPVELAPKTK